MSEVSLEACPDPPTNFTDATLIPDQIAPLHYLHVNNPPRVVGYSLILTASIPGMLGYMLEGLVNLYSTK